MEMEKQIKNFKANGLPLLIGSLPMKNHKEATKLVFEFTPDIPLWVQLPIFKKEGMISQFLQGLPGFSNNTDKNILDTSGSSFDEEILEFFEEYLSVLETDADIKNSRFALSGSRAKGFFEFLNQVNAKNSSFKALKGQITGPVTFCTAVKDEKNKDIFYNDQLREAAIKKLALNAGWQACEFKKTGALPIIFLDEPALAGFGTSAYITITKEDVTKSIDEIVQQIHAQDGLAGVHVCANTQWDMLLDSTIDIISFDAFSYFDKFILYPESIKKYFCKGKILAWGIIPTHKPKIISEQTTKGLVKLLNDQMDQLSETISIDKQTIIAHSFITPSCGTGSLDIDSAKRVLELTQKVSKAFMSR